MSKKAADKQAFLKKKKKRDRGKKECKGKTGPSRKNKQSRSPDGDTVNSMHFLGK